MRRFLVIGAVFCVATTFGTGVTFFVPSEAAAECCDEENRFTWFDCEDPICPPETPVGVYDCGQRGYHIPCDCHIIRCQLKCSRPLS